MVRFALPINQFTAPSQLGEVASKQGQRGKNVSTHFGWILESMILTGKKKKSL